MAELEKEIAQAQAKLTGLRQEESARLKREADHARIVAGVALIEAIARGTWNADELVHIEFRLLDCVTRDSDKAAVRRAVDEGRRRMAMRGAVREISAAEAGVVAVRAAKKLAEAKEPGELPLLRTP